MISTSLGENTSVADMISSPTVQPVTWPFMAWLTAALMGFAGPAIAMLMLLGASESGQAPIALMASPLFAVGLMGAGMIGAALTGRFLIGIGLALISGLILVVLGLALGLPALPAALSTAAAFVIASISFAARGALFAKSAQGNGWFIALFVVAGEAAMLTVAEVSPGALPFWLLVLLPAQWANMAIEASIIGDSVWEAWAPLLALVGTAAATLFVARMLPRRWPYLIMFTGWLALSALVYHQDAPEMPVAEQTAMKQGDLVAEE